MLWLGTLEDITAPMSCDESVRQLPSSVESCSPCQSAEVAWGAPVWEVGNCCRSLLGAVIAEAVHVASVQLSAETATRVSDRSFAWWSMQQT